MSNSLTDILTAVFGVGGVGYAGYHVSRAIYRRIVRDGVEVTKDRSESNFVLQLMNQQKVLNDSNTQLRADFERLSKERAETLSRLGRLESDKEHAEANLADARTEIAMLRRQLSISLISTDGNHATT